MKSNVQRKSVIDDKNQSQTDESNSELQTCAYDSSSDDSDIDDKTRSDSDDINEDCNEELSNVQMEATCLFCCEHSKDVFTMYTHCYNDHKFNIIDILNVIPELDQTKYAKFINFTRDNKPKPTDIMGIITTGKLPWNDESLLNTVCEDDGALCFDVSDDLMELKKCLNQDIHIPFENLEIVNQLRSKESIELDTLRKDYNDLLETMNTMKVTMQRFFEVDGSEKHSDDVISQNILANDIEEACYDKIHIHKEMLQDQHRTTTYIRALEAVFDHLQRHDMLDSVHSILDVGCGTGILSLAAARAANYHGLQNFLVIAADRAKILHEAKKTALLNGKPFEDIHYLNGDIEQMKLPVKQVDIIVSEWMGYGLLSECMLDSIIIARDRFLKPDGLILPHQATLYACLISNDKIYSDIVDYWNDVYGFRMNNLTKLALKDVYIDDIEADSIVSSSECVKVIDVKTIDSKYLPFESDLHFKINRTCITHGITLFFTADFQNFDHVRTERLSTAPTDRSTHWKQSSLYFAQAKMVTIGDVIDCNMIINRYRKDTGRIKVKCNIFDQTQSYIL